MNYSYCRLLTYNSSLISASIKLFMSAGLVETDPEGALAGFSEVVRMESDKAEWCVF